MAQTVTIQLATRNTRYGKLALIWDHFKIIAEAVYDGSIILDP